MEESLGGFNFKEKLFNYHPVLMVSGFLCSMTMSIITMRFIPFSYKTKKYLHLSFNIASVILVTLGLIAVFVSANYKGNNPSGGYYPNLYSLHSFLGLTVLILYTGNFITGLMFYFNINIKKYYLDYSKYHHFVGFLTFILVTLTIISGISQLFTDLDCGYAVTEPDTNPGNKYSKIPLGCRLGNTAGILTMITCVFLTFSMYNFKSFNERIVNKKIIGKMTSAV